MEKPKILTPNLCLYLPDPSEASYALNYFESNEEHLRPTNPVLPHAFFTLVFWENRLSKAIEEFEQDQSVRLFFKVKDHHDFIGSINFTHVVRGPFQACNLGYSIDYKFQGKGFMHEALEAGIKYMFDERHIHRIMANHLTENIRSAKVLNRLGFHTDGSSPDYLFIQGAWRDHVLTSLTNPHWRPRPEDQELFKNAKI